MAEKKELRELVLERVPPGDRWKEIDGTIIYNSLTDALNEVFDKTNIRDYFIAAGDGQVFSVTYRDAEPLPPPKPKKFSIYGD